MRVHTCWLAREGESIVFRHTKDIMKDQKARDMGNGNYGRRKMTAITICGSFFLKVLQLQVVD